MAGLAAAGAAGLVLEGRAAAAAGPVPETATLRMPLLSIGPGCTVPQYLAADLLRAEGFGTIEYVPVVGTSSAGQLANGDVDLSLEFMPDVLPFMEEGAPLTVLAGVHGGCLEVIANTDVSSFADLEGKRVAVSAIDSSEHVFASIMAAYVGLDPVRDIEWVENAKASAKDLFIDGQAEALACWPPDPQDLRARGIGRSLVQTSVDRPWSLYYCCMVVGNADFVRANPVATKLGLRAILKSTDLCSSDPVRATRLLLGYELIREQDIAAQEQTLREIPYAVWRDFDPADSVRFFALRMHELGMIAITPTEVLDRFTDWRFLDEVKQELKA
jgi:NitT/TauT family transport system substrate-binding protein